MRNCNLLLLLALVLPLVCFKADAQVNADFSINYQFPNCSPTVVTFANNSTGVAPLSFQWGFGVAGMTSTLVNPSTTYSKCGTYQVTLTVTNGLGQKSSITKAVTTNCSPVANFSVTGGQSCAPTSATFTSTSTPGTGTISNYVWDFGDGVMGSGNNPSHIYTTPGCKTVTLIVTNSNGCIADTTYKNIVCPATSPVADFTSSSSVSCFAPLKVDYSPNASGGTPPYNYKWNFMGGAPATANSTNPSVNYTSSGFFAAQMVVADSHGCTDTIRKSNYVQIGTNIVDFTITSTKGCAPLQVYCGLAANSAQTISRVWQAIGSTDTTGTSSDFLTTYNNPGTYQLCLSANYPGNCTAQKCTTIVVGSQPVAGFTVSGNNAVCAPPINNVIFTNTSSGTGTLTYQWLFPGGTPSSSTLKNPPPVNYNSCGNYGVTLIVANQQGCSDTMKMDSIVNVNCPVAAVTVSGNSGCVPYDVSFNSTGSTGEPVKWFWNFGDSGNPNSVQSTLQNPSHTYTNPDTKFDVRLIIENALGCRDTVFYKSMIAAGTKPKAKFTAAPTTVCAGQNVSFTSQSTGTNSLTSYHWDFLGGPPYVIMSTKQNPSYTYSDTGYFDVSLIVANNGCADTTETLHLIKVNPPIAVIKITRDCADLDDATLDGTTSIGADTYDWSIPGGKPSTSNSPILSVHFDSTGAFKATLTVTNKKSGCSNTTSKTINIKHLKVDFNVTPDSGCAPLEVCFQNLCVDGYSYRWVIKNSKGTSVFNDTHFAPCDDLTIPDRYDVTLTAVDMNGCIVPLTKPKIITVFGLNALFKGGSYVTGCTPLTASYTDMSSSSTSVPVSWSWDFGDPQSGANNHSTLQNPTHVYNYDGVFQTTLAVTDNHGCVSSYATNSNGVTASKPSVTFAASDSTICLGNSVCFTNTTSSVISDFTYNWNFGDNSSGSLSPSPCYTYNDTGWFTVKLVVKNPYGCSDSLIKNKYIHVITPIANFTADSLSTSCPPLQVHFKNLSVSADTGTKWLWDFGDGATSTAKNPFHIYTYAGKFTVTLKMTATNGCTNTIVFTDYINVTGPQAVVSITPPAGCAPLNTCFHAVSKNTISYIWNFGDGSVFQAGNDSICYSYTKNGVYHPQLIVNDGLGCVYSLPVDSIIVAKPVAGFKVTPHSACGSGVMAFTDTSHSIVKINSWNWNFGDAASGASNTSALQNPNHNYNSVNSYGIQLTIKDILGCTVSATDSVKIHPYPKASFTSNTSAICPKGSIQFTNTSTGDSLISYKWIFSDPSSGASNTSVLQNPSHFFTDPGTYPVKLTITTLYGCTDSSTNNILVRNYPVPNAGPDKSICINNSTTLTGTGGSIYAWSPATGLSVTNTSIVNAAPTSNTTYSLTVTDAFGCTATDNVVITVNPLPVINAGADKNVCKGLSTTLNASGGITYSWSPSLGLNNTAIASPVASPSVTTNYIVIGKDSKGCVNTDTVMINVMPLPIANITASNTTICKGTSSQLTGTGGIIYNWSPAVTLSAGNIANPVATPINTTNYKLIVTDANGCTGNDTLTIIVKPLPPANAGPDKSICINNSTTLTGTGGISYAWSPAAGLSATNTSIVNAAPTSTTTYSLNVTDAFGCTAADNVVVTVNPLPIINAGADKNVCKGLSTTLNAVGGLTYSWSPSVGLNNSAIASPVASPANTTTYIVTGKDNKGCVNIDTVVVNVLALPIANITASGTSACKGISTQLNGSGGIIYNWSPAATLSANNIPNPIATPINTTNYKLSVTDSNGCIGTDTITINVKPLPPVNAGPDEDICINFSAQLNATGAANYQWTPTATLNDSVIANPVAQPTITTTYSVTGTGANGCTAADAVVVNVHYNPTINAGSDKIICYGLSTQLQATGGATYTWTPINGLNNGGISNPTASPKVSTTYVVTGASAYGCLNTDSVIVTVMPPPPAYAGKDAGICFGATTQLNATGGVSYSWTPPASLSNSSIPNPVASPTITTNYIVTVTDTNHCTANDTVQVIVHPLPNINAGPDRNLCEGTSIMLKVTGGVKYRWSPPSALSDTTIDNPIADPTRNIQYIVVGYDQIGCQGRDSVNITVIHPFKANVNPNVDVCIGSAIQLQASGGAIYKWSPPYGLDNPLVADPYASPDVSTNYEVIVSDGMCFADTEYVFVKVNPLPTVYAGKDEMIISGEKVQLNATSTNAISYSWSPPTGLSCTECANPVASPLETTSYVVVCTNPDGCQALDTLIVQVGCTEDVMFIPNAFTPNGDGQNDKFFIRSQGLRSLDYIRIYDRWGEMVYESTDLSEGWDGTYKDKPVMPGVYVYYTQAVCSNGQKLLRTGNITLIR